MQDNVPTDEPYGSTPWDQPVPDEPRRVFVEGFQPAAPMPPSAPTADEYTGNPIVQLAVRSLRTLGVTDRDMAERMLPIWEHYRELSPREIAAVYRRFPEVRV